MVIETSSSGSDNLTNPSPQQLDETNDNLLRPRNLVDYIGQRSVREQLEIFVSAAKLRQEPMAHTLVTGPPGLGKTTLARVLANETSSMLKLTSGPVLEKAGDLAAILTGLEEGGILFIDEVHRLRPQLEEVLYPAMEDFRLDILIGKGPGAKTIQVNLPHFTMIGATTRPGHMTAPFRDRFGISLRLDFYENSELSDIVIRSAQLLKVEITDSGAMEIASRARGTPRIANRLLQRVRDFVLVKGDGKIDKSLAQQALELLGVDNHGLNETDRRFLSLLIENFHGQPAGLDNLAASLAEDKSTLEDTIEPYLLQKGYIIRSARGRMATPKAYEILGMPHQDKHDSQTLSLDV